MCASVARMLESSMILRTRLPISARLEPPDLSVFLVGQHVEIAVRALIDGTDALAPIGQQYFVGNNPVVAESQPRQMLAGQGRDEQGIVPRRKAVAGVECHAR